MFVTLIMLRYFHNGGTHSDNVLCDLLAANKISLRYLCFKDLLSTKKHVCTFIYHVRQSPPRSQC